MFFAVLESWASGHSARNAVSRISENQESPKNQAREEFLLTTGCSEDTPKNPYESKRPFWPPKPPLRGCSKQNNPCLPPVRDYILEQNVIVVDKADWFGIWLRFVLQHQALPSECGFTICCYCLEIAVSSQSHTRESNKQKCKGIQTFRRNWDAISLSFLTCARFRSGYPNHPCVVCSCPALCCHILADTKYMARA